MSTKLEPIKFWCQKVLPLVYDDSLSYYEVLGKTVDYLNKVIEDDKNIITLVNNLEVWVNENKEYIDKYFENLNVQNEINVKLDDMVEDGTFGEIIDPILEQFEQDAMGSLSQQVTDWLDENITPTTPVIDATLTISGAGADAKVTGDEITDLKNAIEQIVNITGGDVNCELVTEKTISANVGGYITFVDHPDRMYLKFKAYNDFKVINKYENVLRIAFIVGEGDRCISNTGWTYNSIGEVESNADYVYYVLCDFTDPTQVPTVVYNDGLVQNNESRIDNLEMNLTAQKNGYWSVVPLNWESGSINYPSGTDKTPDVNVIRTALPRIQLKGNLKFILKNDKYRIKILEFPNLTDAGINDSGWWRYAGTYTVVINTAHYYRIQIATNTATSMNIEEALESILIVYEDDSMEKIPSYWEEYIEEKSQLVNSYLTDGTDKTAFLFVTDTHFNENQSSLNSKGINTALMKYITDRCNIQYIIHGGDLNSEYRSNLGIARELMTIPMGMMRDASEHVFVTRGNHDDNMEGGYRNWDYRITQADSYSYMFRNTKDVVFGETGTYFYHDIPFEKVRIISLDCIDFPYTNDVDSTLMDEKIVAYGHTQLQWLCDTLKNTPEGYNIIIYTHAMIAPSIVTVQHPNDSPQTRAMNFAVVGRILQAFKNRTNFNLDITGWFTSVHQSYYDGVLNADFTECESTIVGVFSGHEHVDCIEDIIVDDAGIGIYNTCTQNSSAMFGDSVISHSYQHPMQIGTTSELVWDVVVIDRKTKHVDMIRIGANGANTDVSEFNVRSFDYE